MTHGSPERPSQAHRKHCKHKLTLEHLHLHLLYLEAHMSTAFDEFNDKLTALKALVTGVKKQSALQGALIANIAEDLAILIAGLPAQGGLSDVEVTALSKGLSEISTDLTEAATAEETQTADLKAAAERFPGTGEIDPADLPIEDGIDPATGQPFMNEAKAQMVRNRKPINAMQENANEQARDQGKAMLARKVEQLTKDEQRKERERNPSMYGQPVTPAQRLNKDGTLPTDRVTRNADQTIRNDGTIRNPDGSIRNPEAADAARNADGSLTYANGDILGADGVLRNAEGKPIQRATSPVAKTRTPSRGR